MELCEQPHGPGARLSDGEADAEDGCQATRLLASKRAMSQEEFAAVLQRHPGRDVNELFAFRKPRHGLGKGRKNASTVLALTPVQHAVMYALAGCINVNNVMSKVQHPVRQAIEKLYGIDRQAFYLWFKNRAPQARRTKPARPPASPVAGSGASSPASSSPPPAARNPPSGCEGGLFPELPEAGFSTGSLGAADVMMAELVQGGQLQLGQVSQLGQLQGLLPAGRGPATVLLPQPSVSSLDNAQLQQLLLAQLASGSGSSALHTIQEPGLQLGQLPQLHDLSGLQPPAPVVLGVASVPGGMVPQGQGLLMSGALGAGPAMGLGMQQTLTQSVMQLEQQRAPSNAVRVVLVQPNQQQQQQQEAQQKAQLQAQLQALQQQQQLQQQRFGVLSAPETSGRMPLAAAIQQYHELSYRGGMGPSVGGANLLLATLPGSGGGYERLEQPMHMLLSQQGLGQPGAGMQRGQVGMQGMQGYQQLAGCAGQRLACDLPAVPGLELRLVSHRPTDLSAVTVRSGDVTKAFDQAAARKAMVAMAPEPQVGQSAPTLDNLHMLAARKVSEPQGGHGQSAPTLDNLLDALRRTGYTQWTLDARSPCQSTSTGGSLPATISL